MKEPKLNIWVTDFWQGLGFGVRTRLSKSALAFLSLPLVRNVYWQRIQTQAKRKLPHMLIIESCNICNLRCVMCAYPEVHKSRQKMVMPMNLFRKLIDDATEFGIHRVSVSGLGEPLIDESIFEKISYAKLKGVFVEFFTNGTLLNREKAERILASGLDHIVFSVDGADKKTYEAIRIGARWEQVVNNIQQFLELRNLKQSKPTVDIIYLVQKKNYVQSAYLTKTLRSLFRGARVKSSFASNWRTEEQVLEEFGLYRTKDQRAIYPCQRIYAPMILSDGTAVPCCMDVKGELALGNIATSSIAEIWDTDTFKKIRAYHLEGKGNRIPICSSCYELIQSGLRWLL